MVTSQSPSCILWFLIVSILFSPNNNWLMGFEVWRRILRNAKINTGGFGECPKRIDQWPTICNECWTVLQMCYSSCTMLSYRSMTNSNRMSPISFADSPVAVHKSWGCGIEFCSCVQTVPTIGHNLTEKDVPNQLKGVLLVRACMAWGRWRRVEKA